MKIKILLLLWMISSGLISSPNYEEGIRYYVKYDLKNKIHTRDGDQSVIYSITKGSKIYIEKVTNTEIIFKVTAFMKPKPLNPNLKYVEPGKLYKIGLNDIEEYDLRKLSGFSGGIATTPFK